MRAVAPAFHVDPLQLARGDDVVVAALDWAEANLGEQPVGVRDCDAQNRARGASATWRRTRRRAISGEAPSKKACLPGREEEFHTGVARGIAYARVIGELLLNDYSRRGFVDARVLRLPTISVRPGLPNKAASSFASGIIREPLSGVASV
jgi:hypothetical protein